MLCRAMAQARPARDGRPAKPSRPCSQQAVHDGLCAWHAASEGHPEFVAEQMRRLEGEGLAKYRTQLVAFSSALLGIQLTTIQRQMAEAIVQYIRVALACGQRTGRTLVLALTLLWFAATRPGALALLSTPSQAQLRNTIWRTLLALVRGKEKKLGIDVANEVPQLGIRFGTGSIILGIASDIGERIQGLTANPAADALAADDRVLIVGDEFSGYPEMLVAGLMSNIAGGGRAVIGGNPLNNTSYFAKRWGAAGWHTLNISSLDVANSPDRKPGQATPEWCAEMDAEFGLESIIYRARVLGLFSASNVNGVFTLTELENGQLRYEQLTPGAFAEAGPLHIGVDIARTGADATCVVARRGHIALAPEVWRIPDLVTVAERVASYARELCKAGERPVIKVDGVGIGAGVVDVLKHTPDIEVVEVQAAGSPQRDAYTNIRSEAAFLCRDWLRSGGCFARDARLEGEMAALTYTFDQRNKLKIRSKDELRRELGRSTDRFDALALATYTTQTKSIAELWCDAEPNLLAWEAQLHSWRL